MKPEYEIFECHKCGEDVYCDSNNEDENGVVVYQGDGFQGKPIFTCPKHYPKGTI